MEGQNLKFADIDKFLEQQNDWLTKHTNCILAINDLLTDIVQPVTAPLQFGINEMMFQSFLLQNSINNFIRPQNNVFNFSSMPMPLQQESISLWKPRETYIMYLRGGNIYVMNDNAEILQKAANLVNAQIRICEPDDNIKVHYLKYILDILPDILKQQENVLNKSKENMCNLKEKVNKLLQSIDEAGNSNQNNS